MPSFSDHECLAILTAEPREQAVAEQALATLHDRYSRFLRLRLLRSYPGLRDADLDELCQETWLRVWKHLDCRIRAEAFRSWLFRIGNHLAIDLFRRPRNQRETSWGERDALESRANHVDMIADAEQLQRCVEKMPARLREFVHRLLNLEDDDQIAADMEKKKSRIYQIKSEVKEMLLNCMERGHEAVSA